MWPAALLGHQAHHGRHIASGAVARDRDLVWIHADFPAMLSHPLGRRISLFIGDREACLRRKRVFHKYHDDLGAVYDLAYGPLMRPKIANHPAAAMKIHYRRKQALAAHRPDNVN